MRYDLDGIAPYKFELVCYEGIVKGSSSSVRQQLRRTDGIKELKGLVSRSVMDRR